MILTFLKLDFKQIFSFSNKIELINSTLDVTPGGLLLNFKTTAKHLNDFEPEIIVNECTQNILACDITNAQVLLVTGGYASDSDSILASTEVSLSSGKNLNR